MNEIVYEFGDKLYVNLTNRCTNRCEFCIRNRAEGIGGHRLWLKSEPTSDETIAALRDADFTRYPEVVFCGYGEPLCAYMTLLSVARFVHGAGVRTRINTNGQGELIAGRAIATDLSDCIDAVSVSLNAPTAAAYDAICHSVYGEAAFDALWDFAKHCREAGIDVEMSVVDSIGSDAIAACRALCDAASVRLKVRAYIDDASKESHTRLN